ncbi:hypothetical protein B0H17DRAFT_1147265 [Mycena rosella]|uniref:Uncharacterized protein n=1 Tax=Mycena rosella TaxID=1033263 RepID=A0AAD7G0C2_MYCRO|nr:hypothetical protein B0H17DRAFT_1147265 [Mycena rosella]
MPFKFLNLAKSWMTTTCQFTPMLLTSIVFPRKILAGREGGRKPAGTQRAAKARPDSQAAGRKTKTTRILEFDVNNALRYPERRARARQARAQAPSRALPNNNRIKPKSRRRGRQTSEAGNGQPASVRIGCTQRAAERGRGGGGGGGVIHAGGAGRGGAGGRRRRARSIDQSRNRSGRAGAIGESIAEEKASTKAPATRQQENGERTMDPAPRRPHYDPPLHIGNRFVTIAETGGGLKIWVGAGSTATRAWRGRTTPPQRG